MSRRVRPSSGTVVAALSWFPSTVPPPSSGEGLELMIANKEGGVSARGTSRFTRRMGAGGSPFGQDRLNEAMEARSRWLLDQQHGDGYWIGELEGDTILESEYVLLMAYLGREGDEVCAKTCKYLHDHQRPDGGWAIYPGGPFDLSASV